MGYIALLYAAGCCTCADALDKSSMCFALLHAAYAVPALLRLTALHGTLL